MDPAPSRAAPSVPPALPLVVQVGFAGSRRLVEPEAHEALDLPRFEEALTQGLADRLGRLSDDLGLSGRHFLCGVSQVAAGADQVFARACAARGLPLRVFLPQPRDAYLEAQGGDGQPDFSPQERAAARAVLDGGTVIQERVVSGAAERSARFEDVNLEIARESDVVVCLLRAQAAGRSGGTVDLRDRARRRGRPVLEIHVRVGADGLPQLEERWLGLEQPFRAPGLPAELGEVAPSELDGRVGIDEYLPHLQQRSSLQAAWRSRLFKGAAFLVIVTHVVATLLAASAFSVHAAAPLRALLAVEVVLLGTGFLVHQRLHHSHAARAWAFTRLVAEVGRSVAALGRTHVAPEHLFALPLGAGMQPLLRTLTVLHLRSTRGTSAEGWEARRDAYVEGRLAGGSRRAQQRYYRDAGAAARRWSRFLRGLFLACSGAALLAVLGKLLAACQACPGVESIDDPVVTFLAVLGVVLPTMAVGALSIGAAFDVEARDLVYAEMERFLGEHVRQLREAASEREFVRLLLETEARLLGETASWFARRHFTNVS